MTQQATVTIGVNGKVWTCAVMTTSYELAAGLSNIESMLPGVGMLFVLPTTELISINMEYMLFPLDIVFIDENMIITEIVQDVDPLNSFNATLPCKYFLEVNAGETVGLIVGDIVTVVYDEYNGDIPIPSSFTGILSDILNGVVSVAFMMVVFGVMLKAPLGKDKKKE